MAFGLPPFVGLDSLVRRRVAQRQMDPFYQPEEPLDPWTGTPVGTAPISPDLGPGMPTLGETEGLTQQAPQRRGFLGRLGQRLGSRQGLSGIATGLASGLRGGDFGESLLLGFSGGLQGNLQSRAAQEAAAAKQASEDREFGLDERRVAADELRAQRTGEGGGATSQERNYEFLTKTLGVPPEEARAMVFRDEAGRDPFTQQPWYMAPGVESSIRDKFLTDATRGPQSPQGTEDVQSIANIYGVSPDAARVMKVSGATRIRPRRTTTTAPNPVTGKMETRETVVQEPIQILTLNQAVQKIMSDTDVERIRDIADGSFTPDDWADDPELHERLRTIATQRFNELSAPARSAFGEQSIFNVP